MFGKVKFLIFFYLIPIAATNSSSNTASINFHRIPADNRRLNRPSCSCFAPAILWQQRL